MSIPTIADFENGGIDLNSLEAVVNGPAGTSVTTRLGTVVPTLLEAQAQLDAQKGQPNGIAELDGDTLVPDAQLPATLERTANKGEVNGYAPLGGDQKVPNANLPAYPPREAPIDGRRYVPEATRIGQKLLTDYHRVSKT